MGGKPYRQGGFCLFSFILIIILIFVLNAGDSLSAKIEGGIPSKRGRGISRETIAPPQPRLIQKDARAAASRKYDRVDAIARLRELAEDVRIAGVVVFPYDKQFIVKCIICRPRCELVAGGVAYHYFVRNRFRSPRVEEAGVDVVADTAAAVLPREEVLICSGGVGA